MSDAGFAERFGGFITSAGSSVWQNPGLFLGMAFMPVKDDKELSEVQDAMYARSASTFFTKVPPQLAQANMAESEGVDPLAPAKMLGRGIMSAFETTEDITQQLIRRPLAAALLAGSLAESETFDKSIFDPYTWRRARIMADNITPGQAFWLAVGTHDILDSEEREAFVNTGFYHYATGTLDAITRLWFDADILAAKGIRSVREKYVVPMIKSDAQIAKYHQKGRANTVQDVIEEATQRELRDVEPGMVRLYGVKGDRGSKWSTSRQRAVDDASEGQVVSFVDVPREEVINRSGAIPIRSVEHPVTGETVEMLPTEMLWKAREFNRGVPGQQISAERYIETRESMRKHGYDLARERESDAIRLEFAKTDDTWTASLTEGNHRVTAARELGIDELPVRVEVARGHYETPRVERVNMPAMKDLTVSDVVEAPQFAEAARGRLRKLRELVEREGDTLGAMSDDVPLSAELDDLAARMRTLGEQVDDVGPEVFHTQASQKLSEDMANVLDVVRRNFGDIDDIKAILDDPHPVRLVRQTGRHRTPIDVTDEVDTNFLEGVLSELDDVPEGWTISSASKVFRNVTDIDNVSEAGLESFILPKRVSNQAEAYLHKVDAAEVLPTPETITQITGNRRALDALEVRLAQTRHALERRLPQASDEGALRTMVDDIDGMADEVRRLARSGDDATPGVQERYQALRARIDDVYGDDDAIQELLHGRMRMPGVEPQVDIIPPNESVHLIERQIFPGDPMGLPKARILADAPDRETREMILSIMMGDTGAAEKFRKEFASTVKLQELAEEAKMISEMGRPTRLTEGGQAILDRKARIINELDELVIDEAFVTKVGGPQRRLDSIMEVLNNPERWPMIEAEIRDIQRMVGRLNVVESLVGSQHRELRVGILRQLKGMPQDTAIFQAGPGRKPMRFVNPRFWASRFGDKRAHPIVDVNDVAASDQVDRMMRMAGVPRETRGRFVKEFTDIPPELSVDRAAKFDEAITVSMRRIMNDMDLDQSAVDAILRQAHSGRRNAHRYLERSYAAGYHDLVPVSDPEVGIAMLALPLTKTQRPQFVTVPDFGAIRKTLERGVQRGWLPKKGSQVTDFSSSVLQSMTWYWKANVLLRVAWPIRVTMLDESFRMMMKFGAMTHLLGASRLARNTTHAYMKELNLKNAKKAGRVGAAVGGSLGFVAGGPAGAGIGAVAGRQAMRKLSAVESMGFDAPVIFGVKAPPALGEPGDVANIYYTKISSGAQMDQFMRIEAAEGSLMRRQMVANSQNWTTITPEKVNHIEAWQHVLNKQWRNDELVRKMLEGMDDDAIKVWFRTADGREYLKNINRLRKNDIDGWLKVLRAYVDETVPTPELRDILVNRGVKKSELRKMFPQDHMRPSVHGAAIEESLGKSLHMDSLDKFIQRGMTVLGTMPTDYLARQPAFNYFYRMELEKIVGAYTRRGARMEAMKKADWDRAAKTARERALQHSRDLLYDLGERREIHHMVRFLQPFLPAMQEVATTWTKLAMERPDYAMRAVKAWTGIKYWDDLVWEDPSTGDQFLTFPQPDFMENITKHSPYFRDAFDEIGQIRLPKKGFNLILQSPLGFGPWVQAIVSKIVKNKPEWEEAVEFIIPYGPSESNIDAFVAGYQRPLKALAKSFTEDENDQVFVTAWNRIYQSRVAKMRQGELDMIDWDDAEAVAAFEEDVTSSTRKLFMLRSFTHFVSPSPPIYDSPYWAYIEAYRVLYDEDPETAFETFIDTYGEEFVDLTIGVTRSNDGIPPTMEGIKLRKDFDDIISKWPEAGSFIAGLDTGVAEDEFARAAYDYQLNTPIRPGASTMMRERMSPEERREAPDIRMGWLKYMKAMDEIDAELISRGLPNMNVKEAEDLRAMKQVITKRLEEEYPAWARERQTMDTGKWKDRFQWLEAVASNETLQQRGSVQGLVEYLEMRKVVIAELQRRGAQGDPSSIDAGANMDIAQTWRTLVASLVERNIAFGPFYHRWLEGDPLTLDTIVVGE